MRYGRVMFCTTCGAAQTTSSLFCTSCGSDLRSKSEGATRTEPERAGSIEADLGAPPPKASRGRIVVLVVSLLILGIAAGVVITSTGAAEFAIGVRYTQKELDSAESAADRKGYSRGDKDGYDRGYEKGSTDGYVSGYSSGETVGYRNGKDDGCSEVFDEIGDNLIAIRYPFNKLSVYGYYYNRYDFLSSFCN